MRRLANHILLIALLPAASVAHAAAGDPQIKTAHPWYPGELAFSTFERLAEHQAAVYQRVTGRAADTDEDKALASWLWRSTHFAHGEDGKGDYFDAGFEKGDWNREYWHGLFAHGFGLCGTTHAQWTAEMQHRLGHARARAFGVTAHNAFEVFLRGGAYGDGRWALLDHDLCTVIFDDAGRRLLGIDEIVPRIDTLKNPDYRPQRQRGWRVSGLADTDASAYTSYRVAEYFAGYAGPPPMIHLRRGETLRRYLEPGLEDGRTYVFWGRNYSSGGIPGPERSRTWINQPDRMFGTKTDAGHHTGQVRFANAVYTYAPDFRSGDYREGVIDESDRHVTFEFHTPYVIAATPPNDQPWGIYDAGCTNGLVLRGNMKCAVNVSTDRGLTWHNLGAARDGMDLTDFVKGHQQYWIRFGAPAAELASADLSMRTVCQMNMATLPRLTDGPNHITYAASGRVIVSAGPNHDQAMAHIVDGSFASRSATLKLHAPRGERAVGIYAASWNRSGNPPDPGHKYHIDYSIDGGKTWQPIVRDWRIERRKPEPDDFWSQSFAYGNVEIEPTATDVLVRFRNDNGRGYRKVEAHLVYEVSRPSPVKVTFAWTNGDGVLRTNSRTYTADAIGREDRSWSFDAGNDVKTRWVEFAAE